MKYDPLYSSVYARNSVLPQLMDCDNHQDKVNVANLCRHKT